MLYSDTLMNSGKISSEGSNGAGGTFHFGQRYNGAVGGAGSGGGSVNIFTKLVKNSGELSAAGGKGGKIIASGANMGAIDGADGGNGTVTVTELSSVLNYNKKEVILNVNDTYNIDENQITYTKLNEIQTEDITVGNIVYEVENQDNNIISVDSNGQVIAKAIGTARVKITDTDNDKITYLIIKVIKEIAETDIKNGNEFTVALKSNGTVWAFGKNDKGQLGSGTKDNSNEAIEVLKEDGEALKDITKIGAGAEAAIALGNDGQVYTWGLCYKSEKKIVQDKDGQEIEETIEVAEEKDRAAVVEGLSDIIEVSAKGDNFYAVDINGNAYIWGKGYEKPTKIETSLKIADVNGELLLGENGRVYRIEKLNTPVTFLKGIYQISNGYDHDLAITVNGYTYSIGNGEEGQIGNGKNFNTKYSQLVKTENEFIKDIIEVSAGEKSSMAVTRNGKVYVWGENTNKKLGVNEEKLNYATELTTVQDKQGNDIQLIKMENVEVGKTHSSISDENGFVYTCRSKYKWTAWNRR